MTKHVVVLKLSRRLSLQRRAFKALDWRIAVAGRGLPCAEVDSIVEIHADKVRHLLLVVHLLVCFIHRHIGAGQERFRLQSRAGAIVGLPRGRIVVESATAGTHVEILCHRVS